MASGSHQTLHLPRLKSWEMSHVRLTAGRPFCAGTHGPEHLECVKDRALQDKSQGESGSLKDIGGETNLQMADEDCVVHEYIPSAKVRTISEFGRRTDP